MENQDSIHLRQYLSGLVYKYYTKKRPCRKNTLKFRQSAQSQLEPAHPNDGELEAISSPVQTGPADDQESIGSSNSSSSSSSASEEKTHQNRWTRILDEVIGCSKIFEREIKTITTCVPKLAKVYLKYEEAIDIEELKKMFAKKKQIEEGLPVLQETNKMFALINPEKDFDNEGLKDIPRQMVGNQISKMLQHELFKEMTEKIRELLENPLSGDSLIEFYQMRSSLLKNTIH